MNELGQSRKIAAILAADVAGYSRLMGQDEADTVRTLAEYRQVFTEHINRHRGHLVDTAGDSVLATFDSPVEAVECAVEIQRELARRNRRLADDRRMNFRIGINLGDVIVSEDGTVYGDGVNIAARLESLAEPGGITVSGTVCEYVENKLPVSFDFTGEQSVKNIAKPVRAFRVGMDWVAASQAAIHTPPTRQRRSKRQAWMLAAVVLFLIAVSLGAWQATRVRHNTSAKRDPVVAVLAFANMSGDPKQDYFSDGLTENIIDSLAQVRNLKVIARNSTFRYKGQTVDVRKVGEELGAKYLVEGSVRRSADTVRVTAQLVETGDGAHLWSKTYDRALTAKNVFAIQDEIATAITSTLAGFYGVLRQEDLAQAKRKPPNELSSYDCVLLGMGYIRSLTLQSFRLARDCSEKAVLVDPEYPQLWSVLGNVYRGEYQFGYDPKPGSLDRAVIATQRAIRIDPIEPDYHGQLAMTNFFLGNLEAFKAEVDRAIALSPNGTTNFGYLGLYFWYAGDYEKGLAFIERAKILDPYYPGWYHNGAFHEHYRKRNYAEALADAERVNMPDFAQGFSLIVAAYGQLGRQGEAQPYIKKIYDLDPNFDARKHWSARFKFQPEYLELLLDGMRKGGLKVSDKNGQK